MIKRALRTCIYPRFSLYLHLEYSHTFHSSCSHSSLDSYQLTWSCFSSWDASMIFVLEQLSSIVWNCKDSLILWFVCKIYHISYIINWKHFRVTGPLCGEFTGTGESPSQRPVTRSFDVFFDLRLNKRLRKQPWGWWFETPSCSLWRHCNV